MLSTIINSESFAWLASTGSKSRENFLSLLHRPWRTYALTENAIACLEELLLALDEPGLPLHNNLSESQIREYVKRRKTSGGTRSTS